MQNQLKILSDQKKLNWKAKSFCCFYLIILISIITANKLITIFLRFFLNSKYNLIIGSSRNHHYYTQILHFVTSISIQIYLSNFGFLQSILFWLCWWTIEWNFPYEVKKLFDVIMTFINEHIIIISYVCHFINICICLSTYSPCHCSFKLLLYWWTCYYHI